MKAIQIDNPCDENLDQMKPTENGGFCQKCSTDVYDFSKLNLLEIKKIFLKNKDQHMCGRFENKQLDELNHDFEVWKMNQPKAFQSKFIFALLLVFGMTLFSCSEEEAQQIANLNAIELKSALAESDRVLSNKVFFAQDAIIVDEMIPLIVNDDFESQTDILDDVPVTNVQISSTKEDILLDAVTVYAPGRLGYIEGAMITHYTFVEYLQETVLDSSKSTLAEEILNTYNPFETKLYPNPTRDQATFSIYIHEPAQFQIEIYAVTGQQIIELHSGELSEGRHEFNLDLTEYEPGTYFVKVWSEKQEETVKVLKVE